MAGKDWAAPHALGLSRALQSAPHKFGYFQALRRLECLYSNKPRIGRALRASDDPVRLAQAPSLAFAPSTLTSFEPGEDGHLSRLVVNFFGLLGPNGPLPLHLTEYASERLLHYHDPTFVRFLDVFHHRLLSFFYRAWANAEPTVNFDRPDSDRFAAVYVGSLIGLGLTSLRNRDAVADRAKLYYAGLLANQARHAEGLKAILRDFFKLPAHILEFVGEWLQLPDLCRCRLGESPDSGTLGVTATLGERVWQCQYKFRIVLGPLGLSEYQRFLPGSDSLERLVAWVRNYAGDELNWDLNLILEKEEVPPLKLGETGQLGWTTWLTDRPLDQDANDLLLNPLALQ